MNTIAIGEMRHRVTLEAPNRTSDGGGGAEETWEILAEVWAALKPLTGRERLEFDALGGELTHEVWLRHRSDVKPECRFRMGTRIFDIRVVIDAAERGRFLRCLAQERDL